MEPKAMEDCIISAELITGEESLDVTESAVMFAGPDGKWAHNTLLDRTKMAWGSLPANVLTEHYKEGCDIVIAFANGDEIHLL